MIISQLKEYIEQHKGASRKELAKHFALSEDGVDAMLDLWSRRGVISKVISTDKVGTIRQVQYRVNDNRMIAINTIL